MTPSALEVETEGEAVLLAVGSKFKLRGLRGLRLPIIWLPGRWLKVLLGPLLGVYTGDRLGSVRRAGLEKELDIRRIRAGPGIATREASEEDPL